MEMYEGLNVFLNLVLDGDDWSDSLPVCIIPEETTPLYWERLEGTSLECWLLHHLSLYPQSLHSDTGTVP
jgi:hypothetical protein